MTQPQGPSAQMPKTVFDCPRCGEQVHLLIRTRTWADEFCSSCDFPMFWAPAVEEANRRFVPPEYDRDFAAPPSSSAPEEQGTSVACHSCRTLNPKEATYCQRCGSPLGAMPISPTSTDRRIAPVFLALLVLAAVAVVISIAWLALR